MNIFSPKTSPSGQDFDYLDPAVIYLDSACQTLRPQQTIDAEKKYYQEFNACGHRVKYEWGEKVDQATDEARLQILRRLKKSEKEYTVAFTLNTTTGINLVLHQLPADRFEQIITSEIEHNSVFLPSITWAKKQQKKRTVLPRSPDGGLMYEKEALAKSVVILNSMSNIDGRELVNGEQLAQDVHEQDGILLLDAAQSMGHSVELLQKIDFDALFSSAHKMYAPSLGFIVIKKELLKQLDNFLLGGGTVNDVTENDFELIREEPEVYAPLELGLQNWAGLVGLHETLNWLEKFKPEGKGQNEQQHAMADQLWQGLKSIPEVKIVNEKASVINAIYSDKIDAHRLAMFLGSQQIMCRSGYFCCHYYLQHVKKYPPLLRISLGLQNTSEQIEKFLSILQQLIKNV